MAVVKHVEAGELVGAEAHNEMRKHQVAARVTVDWSKGRGGEARDGGWDRESDGR